MKDLFDVHCHMVPGVDDGASDLEESLAMLKMEYRDGVRNIIVTPHYRRRMFETPAKKVSEAAGGGKKGVSGSVALSWM